MRISQKNENSERKSCPQPPPPSRPQSADNRLKFPKAARLLKKSEFQRVFQARQRHIGKVLLIDFRRGSSLCPKLGISVSKRYGKAHDRNYFKRLVREAFRLFAPRLPSNLEMNVQPRLLPDPIYQEGILEDFQAFAKALATASTSR